MDRREFLASIPAFLLLCQSGGRGGGEALAEGAEAAKKKEQLWGMGIRADKCIGCARCMDACKIENDVPREPFFFRTWVERYTIKTDQSVVCECLAVDDGPGRDKVEEKDILRSFFVPKLCNHCRNAPCTQVCPVSATFSTKEGAVIIDKERCVGCGYCIQACPYGARYMHPVTHTADKCSFCYHRVTKGLLPACVEVCPTQARVFGDLNSVASPLTRFQRMEKIVVLKPGLNTEPKVYYSDLDGEVR